MKKMGLSIVDPRGTKRCSHQVAQEISGLIVPESQEKLANMLPQRPEDLLQQMEKGLTILAILNEEMVGHITLWQYNTTNWGEVGTLIVAPQFRGKEIGKTLVKTLSERFPNPIRAVTTVKTERAQHIFCTNGFDIINFDELRKVSGSAWRECCPCFFPPEACPKRDTECKLLFRRG